MRRRSSARRSFSEGSYWKPEASAARFERLMSSNDDLFRVRREFALTRLVPLVHTVRASVPQYAHLMRTVLSDTMPYVQGHGVVFPERIPRSPQVAERASSRQVGYSKQVSRYLSSVISPEPLLRRALECAKHAIRREVILARGHGGGDHKPPKYRTNWRC